MKSKISAVKPKSSAKGGPSRSSIRRKLNVAISNAAKKRKICQPPLKISRTVEQIDQTKEDWRENTSKLMFTAALGLTPTDGWKGLPQLQLKIAPASPVVLAQIKERYRVERLKRLQVLGEKEKIMKERMMKLVKFSQGPKYTSSVGTNSMSSSMSNISTDSSHLVPDVIDLVSEDEVCSSSTASQCKPAFIQVTATATNLRQSPISKDKMKDESLFRWLNGTSSSPPANPAKIVEFVDLASDEEPDKLYILPNYPNIHVTMVK